MVVGRCHFPQCFQVFFFRVVNGQDCMVKSQTGQWILDVNYRSVTGPSLTLYHTIPTFYNPKEESLENTVIKGENAGNQHFLLFSQCFLFFQREKCSF